MTKQKRPAPLFVRNTHGTFVAPSEAAIQYVLGFQNSKHALIGEWIIRAYDGTEYAEAFAHFERYTDRTLAIMACDLDGDRIERGMAEDAESVRKFEEHEARKKQPKITLRGRRTLTGEELQRGLRYRCTARLKGARQCCLESDHDSDHSLVAARGTSVISTLAISAGTPQDLAVARAKGIEAFKAKQHGMPVESKCYACDATATGTAKRKRGAVTRTLLACERHSETEQEPKQSLARSRNGIRPGVSVITLDTSGGIKQVATYLAKPTLDARTDELAPHELETIARLVNHIASTSGAERSALLANVKLLVWRSAVLASVGKACTCDLAATDGNHARSCPARKAVR